jgi:hypothetical protein
MKNTKNLLITGVALVVALFASVQVSAMNRQENPNLDKNTKSYLNSYISSMDSAVRDEQKYLIKLSQEQGTTSLINHTRQEERIKKLKGCSKFAEEILYDNRYSFNEKEVKYILGLLSSTMLSRS